MEFTYKFPLNDGANLVIDAECTEDDTIIMGVSCPDGALSALRVLEAYLNFDAIEARAREEYRERMAEIVAARKAAGVAGERSA